jgi:hypothetical protein
MSVNDSALKPNHPFLQDDVCEGFRAPDLGWVGVQRETGSGPGLGSFDSGLSFFSNFWAGPADTAKAFAEALVRSFQACLPDMTPLDPGADLVPTVSVCYWEDTAIGFGLVATTSATADFLMPSDGGNLLPSIDMFDDQMDQVGFDDNENAPRNLISKMVNMEHLSAKQFFNLVVGCVVPEDRQALYDQHNDFATEDKIAAGARLGGLGRF